MNFGIELARGDWISFMNSEDRFFNSQVIEKVFNDSPSDADVIYGNCEIRYQDFKRIKKAVGLQKFWKGMPFCHQSTFCKTILHKKNLFDTRYEVGADFNFFYKVFISKRKFLYHDSTISSTSSLGLTDLNRLKVVKEYWHCVRSYNHNFKIHLYYTFRVVVCALKIIIKTILGKKLTSYIQKLKYELSNDISKKNKEHFHK